jgi:hypothetical protein
MPLDIKDRVSALIDEAGRIERESETAYLELGRLFPRISAEMERGTAGGERSLEAMASLAEADRGKDTAAFVAKAAAFFAALRERDSSFLERINDGITRLGALEQIIARVRADSEEMEIISLNAMTVALKSGSEGKAFSVITDELKRLSGRTIALTEEVTGNGRFLLEFFGRLRNALDELDGFQRDFFSTIDTTLGSGFAEIERDLSGATSFFSSLLAEARSVREPVTRVMGEIQLQDIVRQSLQHVGLSLEEARAAAASADPRELAFVAAVAELTRSLIDDVAAKLGASAQSFGADMAAVSEIVGASERKRLEYLGTAAVAGACADGQAFQSGSERYLALKRDVVTMASRLADHVKGLDSSFKGLAALLSRFQNIVVASRIEVAKTKALAGVATTVGEMIALTERIETDVTEAMETTKDFTRLAGEAIGAYAVEGSGGRGGPVGGEGERLVATLRRVEGDMGRLSSEKESLRCAIDDFSLYTEDFIALISRAGEELGRLRALVDSLRAVGGGIGELEASLRESLGPDAAEVESERIRRMVERFTIFTHKKAAGAIGRFAVEEGGKAGEVTLF